MTADPKDDPGARRQPARRFFSDAEKHAIALESDQPGVSVSQGRAQARDRHGHAVSPGACSSAWRRRSAPSLRPVDLTESTQAALLLRDLVQPPDGMTAIVLPDGRRVFAPAGSDPNAVREHLECGGTDI
ncbi:hypothetical protein [Mesorhizobium sp.]|uniref:hypothetical protein n=1 Tax=Mesorhizobium sp. TaxID=1871066 RepID=UPI0025FF8318|nr:hypothetical protein [Mesorhizobium sp.]